MKLAQTVRMLQHVFLTQTSCGSRNFDKCLKQLTLYLSQKNSAQNLCNIFPTLQQSLKHTTENKALFEIPLTPRGQRGIIIYIK